MASVEQLVADLCDPELREHALFDLSEKRDIFQDLAPLLWYSYGTIAMLLQEIVSIYPALSPPTLSPDASKRVCNALALLQVTRARVTETSLHVECVASHPDTQILFLNAHIPQYLYPFLNTTSKTRPFDHLRLASLGVIGPLSKVDIPEFISYLLQTEIIPPLLHTMEVGSELSKTVATFIVQNILLDNLGLQHVCATFERFFAVHKILANMIVSLVEQPSTRLLKYIIRCYLRLSENGRACKALTGGLPAMLKDGTFNRCLHLFSDMKHQLRHLLLSKDDPATRRWLQQLLHNVAGAQAVSSLHMMGN